MWNWEIAVEILFNTEKSRVLQRKAERDEGKEDWLRESV
jgi:hypothetical protein